MDAQDSVLQQVRVLAAANENIEVLWLYGSQAKGTAQPASDYDFALALVQDYLNMDPARVIAVIQSQKHKKLIDFALQQLTA